MTSQIHGPAGVAEKLIIPPGPHADMTVAHYLITAQGQAPWDQYLLAAIRLTEAEGWPAPVLQFDGATHEIMMLALDPDKGPYAPGDMETRFGPGAPEDGKLPVLIPINVAVQFTATDGEMETLLQYAALGVVKGRLPAEPMFGQQSHHDQWLGTLVKTLAHMRGEEHAP